MMNIKHKIIWSLVVLALLLGLGFPVIASSEALSLRSLQKMVILENGRKKPLDTFAENLLKQFSGSNRVAKLSAIQWLARALFTPELSAHDKVFLVTNPEVLDSMQVPQQGKARDRYSFAQLEKGLPSLRQLAIKVNNIDPKSRSFIETEIFSLYNNIYMYQQLTSCLQFLFPHPDFVITQSDVLTALDLPAAQKEFCLLDIYQRKDKILAIVTASQQKAPAELSPVEKTVVELSGRLLNWSQFYKDLPLTIIPGLVPSAGEKEEKWHSPWDLLTPSADGTVPKELFYLRDLVLAYRVANQAQFDAAVASFNARILELAGGRFNEKTIAMEVFYNQIDPFYKAKFFFGFSILLLLFSFIALKKWFYRFSFLLLIIGFLLQLGGVIVRMIIMARPPVTNLYETFVFTGLITALLGIILELAKKKNIGILTGSLAGLVMLMIAGKYAMEGDTMGMLVAVLDSNFWLAFHVITIILGYSGVLLSGFIGHVYILQRLFRPRRKEMLQNTFQAVYAIQAFGIIFTFLGTVLGGIWADQSWGRFWGWDPKENGALLILLWSAILFHARMTRWIGETGFSLGTIFGVVCVALAWFGVNLLGVGLHSYGFTSGVANSLFIFVVVELLFIFITGFLLKFGQKEVVA